MTSIRTNLPNLIIAGVHKAGTTSLYTYLSQHPQICPSFKKEIGFFTPLISGKPTPSIEEYASYFKHCVDQTFRLEASPSYFYGRENVAAAIKNELPAAKIILILREPTDRLISYFSRAVSKSTLPADMGFQDYLAISKQKLESSENDVYARGVREGMYINYIRPWQSTFGNDLKIVFFDDLKDDALSLTASICSWLRLETSCFESRDFTVENRTMQYKHRTLHRYIKDVYMKSEAFWRKHYWLKQRLRGVYNALNAEKDSRLKSIDDATVAGLRAFYAPYNKQLRNHLDSSNHELLPDWLA